MTQEVKLRRVQCLYQAENARFLLECDFSKQYNNYYRKRLEKTRPYLEYNARSKWNSSIPICDLASDSSQCIIIGTIFKRMKLQPDVVEELSKGDFHVKCERYLGHYTSLDDTLVLESDTEESISLVGNILPKHFVTGICVALLGHSIDDGSQFLVEDICYAEPNRHLLYDVLQLSQINNPNQSFYVESHDAPVYLMVVSGLGFHHEMEKNSALTQALQDMIDFIWGGARFANDERSHRVARILVLGNSLHEGRLARNDDDDDEDLGIDPDDIVTRMKRSRQVKQYTKSITAVKNMDDFFAQLSKTINVDVMPGPSDPAPHLMPQQPFHPCMFPKSCMYSTFNCTTNPHHAIYDGQVELLATAGQNIDIIKKFSDLQSSIEIMKCHLKWGNCAPSAPDNLYSVPYEDEDPYVIDFVPDIYIAGCQDAYQSDHHYYSSSEPIQSVSQNVSFTSSRTESTLINVTPESIHLRATQSSDTVTTPGTPSTPDYDLNQSNNFMSSTPVANLRPKLAGELNLTPSDSSTDEGTPNDYVPNQLALLRKTNESLLKPKKSRTLLVTVPEFHKTFSCVLIDLKSITPQILSFKI